MAGVEEAQSSQPYTDLGDDEGIIRDGFPTQQGDKEGAYDVIHLMSEWSIPILSMGFLI